MTGPEATTHAGRPMAAAILVGGYAAVVALSPAPMAMALAAPLLCLPILWWVLSGPQRWIGLFFAAALLLPPLPIALGNSGPHPALAVAAIGLLAGFVRSGEWRIRFDAVTAALTGLSCVLLASAAFAAVYSGAVVAAGSLARVGLFGITVYVFLYRAHGPLYYGDRPMRGVRWLFLAAVAAATFACVDFYYQLPAPAGYGPQFVWLDSGVFRRAQGLFYEASTLGNVCAFFLVMAAVGLFRHEGEQPLRRGWLLAGGVILSAALIFSYSRASLLNVGVSLCTLAYVRRIRLKRVATALVLSILAGAGAVYAVFPAFAMSYWIRLSASFEYFWSSPEGVLSGRVASWRALIDFVAEHPWHAVFGIGYKTLPYSDFAGAPVIADNMYLSLLVETGIVGVAVFLWLNVAILRSALRAARSHSAVAVFFGTWIFCFWCGEMVQMLSGDLLTYWRVLPLYFWVLAVAMRAAREDETE